MENDTTPGLTIAGRTFRPSDGFSFQSYNWTTSNLACVDTEGVTDFRELLARIAESGRDAAMLAGLVVEEVDGKLQPWTPETARANTKLFASVSDMAEMMALQVVLIEVLPGFFPGVAVSEPSSATASDLSSTIPASTSEPTPSEMASETPSASTASLPEA